MKITSIMLDNGAQLCDALLADISKGRVKIEADQKDGVIDRLLDIRYVFDNAKTVLEHDDEDES